MVKNQYLVGKKLNNGAFGQIRLGRDLHHRCNRVSTSPRGRENECGEDNKDKSSEDVDSDGDDLSGDDLVAIKLEPAATRIPMLGLEFRLVPT